MAKKKCDAAAGKWCGGVDHVFQFANPVSKGLVAVDVVDVKTYARGHGLIYRPKANARGYFWLNFCPFCGANVEEHIKKKKR